MLEIIGLVLSVMSVILIPLFAVIIRMTIRWTTVETSLAALTSDMRELVQNKEQVHASMLESMREDRKATDRRLRWLEENVWNQQGRAA